MSSKVEIPICENCRSRIKSIFCEFSDQNAKELSLIKGHNTYKKKQIIFQEGSRPAGLFCIHSGKVKIYKTGDEGKGQIVRLAKEGDVLGYRSLISREVYAASAEALDDASICFIPKNVFLNLIQSDPKFSFKIIELLSHDLKISEEKITNIAQKPVRERIAEAILILKNTYGLENDHATLNISLTREDLANMVGTASETLIRLLTEFKKEKIIELQGKKIKLLNFKKLTHLANLYD